MARHFLNRSHIEFVDTAVTGISEMHHNSPGLVLQHAEILQLHTKEGSGTPQHHKEGWRAEIRED